MNKPFNAPISPFAALHPQVPAAKTGLSQLVQQLLAQPLESFTQPSSEAEPITYAAMLLDESGSMTIHRASALDGFNSQVEVIREGAKGAGKTRVSLTKFSSVPRPVIVASPVEALLPLEPAQYKPSGGTALFDAIGLTIEQLLEQPAIHSPTTAVLVAIFTDGEENSSVRYDGATLKQLILRLEATGRWTFTLMGPQGNSVELASILNISKGNVSTFNPGDQSSTKEAFGTMAGATASYMAMRGMGITASASLYSDLEPK